jgi:hypothetical protein
MLFGRRKTEQCDLALRDCFSVKLPNPGVSDVADL